MNLHEYQGKELLSVANQLNKETGTSWWVIKAQIHAGGRGKGGGVKLAKSIEDVEKISSEILGMKLITPQTSSEGKLVNQILVAEDVYYPGPNENLEFYISVLLNRSTGKNMIMYSTEGGVDIETVAEKTPELIYTEEINPLFGLTEEQASNIASNLKLSGKAYAEMITFVKSLYNAYDSIDASLFEINPVIKASKSTKSDGFSIVVPL